MNFLFVALGGALGAVLRYAISLIPVKTEFPILTLVTNIVGGIYDDRLLVKPVKSVIMYMPETIYELPYKGAKEMLFVDNVDNREFLTGLFNAMYDELPTPKKKKTC